MWFKNLRFYCLTKPFDHYIKGLEAAMSDRPFRPCNNYEKSTMGWITPIEDEITDAADSNYAHVIEGYVMFCAKRQERLLPASVVREAANEKIAEIEESQGRKIYRKEKRQIQEDTAAILLPQAFTRSQLTYGYLSEKENLLIINAATPAKAEEFINLLRETLGTFPVGLPSSNRSPSDAMTRWLKDQKATNNFELTEDCELFNPLDGGNVIRCKGQDLKSDEIAAHIESGKKAKNLGVVWNNFLTCNVADDLGIKRLRFEEIKEENEGYGEESARQKFDQDFTLMALGLSSFFDSLFAAFGGLGDPGKMEKAD
jgi:recombination associated protein RdgC